MTATSGGFLQDDTLHSPVQSLARPRWFPFCQQDETTDVHYWSETRRPLTILIFLLPLLLVYELGTQQLDEISSTIRNGADCWLRSFLLESGVSGSWLLPGLLVGGLFAWHVISHQPWRCSLETLSGMFGESLLFALLLIVMGQSLCVTFERMNSVPWANIHLAHDSSHASVISFLGAGIYEEVTFRLLLLPLCYGVMRVLLIPARISILCAVLTTSFLFAIAHYVEPEDAATLAQSVQDATSRIIHDPSLWYGFTFRTIAGLFFAGLFLVRGLGIAVGCHAIYDLLVGILMQPPA